MHQRRVTVLKRSDSRHSYIVYPSDESGDRQAVETVNNYSESPQREVPSIDPIQTVEQLIHANNLSLRSSLRK